MATWDYDTDDYVDITGHEEDCDCSWCHKAWHNPVSDWAICEACKQINLKELDNEKN